MAEQTLKHSSTPWWRTDVYDDDTVIPADFNRHTGPFDLALVRAWPDGRTDAGWGLDTGFMDHYHQNDFNERKVIYGYERDRWAFAFVMRSLDLVCIDIDGKNGGFDTAKQLVLPPTLAETSKSGNGYHLFYAVPQPWDLNNGFDAIKDKIGFVQGVDVRGTGCVYHHKQQRWNNRDIAVLPQHIADRLLIKQHQKAASVARITSVLASNDNLEVLMLQDELLTELAKPMPAGNRNNTLFAIGSQMKLAGVEDWDKKVEERADQVGLDSGEIDKLVRNIDRYAV